MELSLKAPFAGTVAPSTPPPATRSRSAPRCSWSTRRTGTTHERAADGGPRPGAARSAVTIYEVGPRDGLQNEKALVPTEVKAEFIRRLLAAGLPIVEATSFVHPTWVPQLADAEDLMTLLIDELGDAGRDLPVLVPNERGLDRALELGCRHVAIFGSATETFAQKNLNRSLDEQFAMFEPTVRRARDAGLDVRAYVSMCFGDPWEGAVPVEQVVDGRQAALRPRRQPAQPRRHDRRRHGRPRHAPWSTRSTRPAAPSTSSRCTSTTPTARRWPTRPPRCAPASRRTTRAPAASAAAPTPRAPPATSPPRTWSGCSRPRHRARRRPRRAWSRRGRGWPATSAAPVRRAVVRRAAVR